MIIAGAGEWLRETGTLVIEIGEFQGDVVRSLARQAGFTHVGVEQDLAARDRCPRRPPLTPHPRGPVVVRFRT